jgi:hypothetical protein
VQTAARDLATIHDALPVKFLLEGESLPLERQFFYGLMDSELALIREGGRHEAIEIATATG